jgi:alpha/beta superfamily hydrolase
LALPSSGSPVLQGAHQALAFTGFAFGAYVAIALVLITLGMILRTLAARTNKAR